MVNAPFELGCGGYLSRGNSVPEAGEVRIDKWLWAARFFRTRSLAAAAVGGGHVQVNGVRVKPSRMLRVGDRLRVRRGDEDFEIEILVLSGQRASAPVAATLYHEDEKDRLRREQAREARRAAGSMAPHPPRRPDKRDRRKIIDFLKKETLPERHE